MARLLSAWEAVKLHLEVSEKNRAESRLGTQQRLLQPSEQHSMRVAVEAVLGKLKDKEVPSRSLLASKLEQIESNQPIVENLQEVASLEDSELETYSAVIDPATNVLKVKPGKRFSDYVLGPQVAGLVTGDGRKPTWSLILQFEHEARKAAYKWLRDGEVTTLDAAFSRAMVDTEVLQRHLIIPFSLNVSARTSDDMPNTWVERPPRGGRGRGRGNAGRGNAARGARNQQLKNSNQASEFKGKLTKDANGEPICWRFNRKGGGDGFTGADDCTLCMLYLRAGSPLRGELGPWIAKDSLGRSFMVDEFDMSLLDTDPHGEHRWEELMQDFQGHASFCLDMAGDPEILLAKPGWIKKAVIEDLYPGTVVMTT
ncbi:unnamed protein product, partial [Symbiodinium sp. KB8]